MACSRCAAHRVDPIRQHRPADPVTLGVIAAHGRDEIPGRAVLDADGYDLEVKVMRLGDELVQFAGRGSVHRGAVDQRP